MLDDATLSMNILQFAGKSFDYDASVDIGGTEFAIFARTETETEAKLRPELIRMKVVVPKSWVVYEEETDLLVLSAGSATGAPARRRSAGTTLLEPEEFRDQGIDWRRESAAANQRVYVPKEWAARILSPAGRTALGLPP